MPLFKGAILRSLMSVLLLVTAPIPAQLSRAGAVSGTVTAPDGSLVPSATILLAPLDAPARTTSTTPDGSFSLSDLASGTYTLTASAPGFAPYTQPSVAVAIGRITHLAIRLTLPTLQQTVTINASQASFDAAQTSSVVNIDRDRIEELPIPSRNYLTFVLLSPQVAPANPALAAQQSATLSAGGFSFGGLRPGSNAIYLDGVDDDDEFTGGSRTQLSPEAISDFQIVNHGFAAESGGGAGGAINVQTRSGVNRPHGDAFLFAQNGALNATPPLTLVPGKPDENRLRAGVALGAPIQRDRTFFYVAAEQELAHGQDANDLSPNTIAQINTALQHSGPLPELTLQPGFISTTDQETELSARIDRTLSPTQAVMLRYAFTNGRAVNDAFQTDDLSDRTARGSAFTADNSLNGTLSSTLSPRALNRLNFELAQRRAVQRTATTLPGILIPGIAHLGTPYFGNSRRFETHLEATDAFSLQLNHHLVQIGFSADRIALRTHISDGSQGLFVFPSIAALHSGDADFFTQSFGSPNTNFTEFRLAAYLQDHWSPRPTLAIDYGLRYEVNRLPSPLPQHSINFSPRIGLAWTARPSLLIRTGFGIFYDRFQLATINRILQLDGTHAFTLIVEDSAAAALYRTGTLPTQPIPGIAPSIWTANPQLANPYSEVASLSLEQSLPLQSTLSAEYQYVHGVKLGRTTNINLAPPVLLTQQNATAIDITAPNPQQLSQPVFSRARNNPAYDAINQFATSANSTYNAATITLNRQFTDDVQLLVGYTFSKTLDNASSDAEQPQNPFSLSGERALSLQDQRHRITLSGLWLIGPDLGDPQDAVANANPGRLMRILTGLELAPIFSLTSGYRANPIVGLDTNREHIFPFAARHNGYSRNSLATPANINFDLRILRMIPLAAGHLDIVAESFNLLNHPNISLLNTAFGSSTTPAPTFSRPIEASTARRIQFSLDFEF